MSSLGAVHGWGPHRNFLVKLAALAVAPLARLHSLGQWVHLDWLQLKSEFDLENEPRPYPLAVAPPWLGLTSSGLGSQDMATSLVYRSPFRFQISDQTFWVPFRPCSGR